jgi:hypothetical protein
MPRLKAIDPSMNLLPIDSSVQLYPGIIEYVRSEVGLEGRRAVEAVMRDLAGYFPV